MCTLQEHKKYETSEFHFTIVYCFFCRKNTSSDYAPGQEWTYDDPLSRWPIQKSDPFDPRSGDPLPDL